METQVTEKELREITEKYGDPREVMRVDPGVEAFIGKHAVPRMQPLMKGEWWEELKFQPDGLQPYLKRLKKYALLGGVIFVISAVRGFVTVEKVPQEHKIHLPKPQLPCISREELAKNAYRAYLESKSKNEQEELTKFFAEWCSAVSDNISDGFVPLMATYVLCMKQELPEEVVRDARADERDARLLCQALSQEWANEVFFLLDRKLVGKAVGPIAGKITYKPHPFLTTTAEKYLRLMQKRYEDRLRPPVYRLLQYVRRTTKYCTGIAAIRAYNNPVRDPFLVPHKVGTRDYKARLLMSIMMKVDPPRFRKLIAKWRSLTLFGDNDKVRRRYFRQKFGLTKEEFDEAEREYWEKHPDAKPKGENAADERGGAAHPAKQGRDIQRPGTKDTGTKGDRVKQPAGKSV